jgi:ribonuclease G
MCAPARLHRAVGALGRVLRDVLNDEVERVLIDSRRALDEALAFVDRVHPAMRPRFGLYEGTTPLFEAHGIEAQIEKALRPRLWLKSGGSIVINQTEALVAIDVNTGKYVGGRRLEETILTTNLEAVREIVRQIRLRDLGGIIVIDFIDMEEAASREEVVRALEEEMRRDRSKSRVQPISPFGLVEITRQRTKRSLERILCRPCPACGGSGRVKSAETVCFEIQRALQGKGTGPGARFAVRAHPDVAALLEVQRAAPATGEPAPAAVRVQADPSLSRDEFSIEPV